MSSENSTPHFPLFVGLLYVGSGYPFVAGAFFTGIFGSAAQTEYNELKARFGKPVVVDFFARFEALVEFALEDDPESRRLVKTLSSTQPQPDPAVDLPGFVAALQSAGTAPGTGFSAKRLLGTFLTSALRDRAYAALERTHGPGSADAVERVLGAIVVDAGKIIA